MIVYEETPSQFKYTASCISRAGEIIKGINAPCRMHLTMGGCHPEFVTTFCACMNTSQNKEQCKHLLAHAKVRNN